MAEPEPVITVNITAHAFDRASQRVWRVWRKTRINDEGLATWLRRTALEALRHHRHCLNERLVYNGVVYVFNYQGKFPILQTIMKTKPCPKKVVTIKDRLYL